ncbi:MAG: glutaminase [Xenococcaceae cyanobacterium]
MNRLANLDRGQLHRWLDRASQEAQSGQPADYIPLLQAANSNDLVVQILGLEGEIFSYGNLSLTFALMSLVKPFLLLYMLSHFGEEFVFERVGGEFSNYPFNSLPQLIEDNGFPRNPMLNSGAIALASLLPDRDSVSRCENLCLWLNSLGNCQLFLSESMLRSVQSKTNPNNQAIAKELEIRGQIENADLALDTYNHICCLSGTIIDLARLGLLLLGYSPTLLTKHCQIVREIMTNCGLYQASKQFFDRVGFPTKSGVSGAVLSLVPNQGAIACYSPPLDKRGNSVAGLFLVEQIAKSIIF